MSGVQLTGEPALTGLSGENHHIAFRGLAVFVDFVNVAAGQDHALGDLAPNGSGFEVCDEEHLRANERLGFVERFDARTDLPAFFGAVIQLNPKQFVGVGMGLAGFDGANAKFELQKFIEGNGGFGLAGRGHAWSF